MKVLDPQSAVLTNAELYQFLQNARQIQPQKPQGAYTLTNLSGLNAIKKDFNHYATSTTPHVTTQQDTDLWLPDLNRRLKPYGLTKTEVLNLLNVGVGAGVETDEVDADTLAGRDVAFFKVAVEEADDRFASDDDAKILEIVGIIRDILQTHQNN